MTKTRDNGQFIEINGENSMTNFFSSRLFHLKTDKRHFLVYFFLHRIHQKDARFVATGIKIRDYVSFSLLFCNAQQCHEFSSFSVVFFFCVFFIDEVALFMRQLVLTFARRQPRG